MKKKALVTGLSLCLMLGQTSAFATVADDMDGFFNDVGFASNTTSTQADLPEHVHNQLQLQRRLN